MHLYSSAPIKSSIMWRESCYGNKDLAMLIIFMFALNLVRCIAGLSVLLSFTNIFVRIFKSLFYYYYIKIMFSDRRWKIGVFTCPCPLTPHNPNSSIFSNHHNFSFKAAEDVRGTSPLILPSAIELNGNSFHAQKYQNITLKCLSDAPIQWRLWRNQEKFDHRITQIELNDQNIYETHLDLFNVTHKFIGFYYCIKNSSVNSNLQTQFQNHLASKIYVFVSGA